MTLRQMKARIQINPPLIFTVTLSWNRKDDTLDCLQSIQASDYPNLHSILVDNASTDGTVERSRSVFPSVTVITNEVNLGYAAGVNVGLRYALQQDADFVLIVDNDAILAPDTIRCMVDVARQDPSAGLFTPKILYHSRPGVIWCAGYRQRAITLAAVNGNGNQPESAVHGEPRRVDYAPCCGLLIRRSVLKQTGFLEERFFIYYEDLDFCIRVRQAGFHLLNVPGARVWHKVSASAGEGSPLQKYYLARSSIYFFFRHTPVALLPLIVPYRIGSATRTMIRALRSGKREVALAYLRGLRDGAADVFGYYRVPRDKGLK